MEFILRAITLAALIAVGICAANVAWRFGWWGGWHLRHLPARVSHSRGTVHFEAQRYGLAVRWFRRAVWWSPKVAASLAMLGQSLHRADRHAEALAPLDRALKLDPGLVELWGCLGHSQHAEEAARRSLDLHPTIRTAFSCWVNYW